MIDIKLLGTRSGQYYGDLNDIEYDANGNLLTVTGAAAARQAITKILLTSLGNQPFPSYGTSLNNLIQTTVVNADSTQEAISNTILQALAYYNTVNTAPLPAEAISNVTSLTITYDGTSTFQIAVNLLMQDGSTLSIPMGV